MRENNFLISVLVSFPRWHCVLNVLNINLVCLCVSVCMQTRAIIRRWVKKKIAHYRDILWELMQFCFSSTFVFSIVFIRRTGYCKQNNTTVKSKLYSYKGLLNNSSVYFLRFYYFGYIQLICYGLHYFRFLNKRENIYIWPQHGLKHDLQVEFEIHFDWQKVIFRGLTPVKVSLNDSRWC